MHAATMTRLLLQPSLNFLAHLSPDVFKSVRKYAEDAILHTDPADHVMHMDAWAQHAPAWRQHMVMMSTGEGFTDMSPAANSKIRVWPLPKSTRPSCMWMLVDMVSDVCLPI